MTGVIARRRAAALAVCVLALVVAACGNLDEPAGADGGVPGDCRASPTSCATGQSCQPCWGDGGATAYICLPDSVIC